MVVAVANNSDLGLYDVMAGTPITKRDQLRANLYNYGSSTPHDSVDPAIDISSPPSLKLAMPPIKGHIQDLYLLKSTRASLAKKHLF